MNTISLNVTVSRLVILYSSLASLVPSPTPSFSSLEGIERTKQRHRSLSQSSQDQRLGRRIMISGTFQCTTVLD